MVLARVAFEDSSLGAALLCRDITKELATKENLGLSSLVFNNTSNAVFISHPKGNILAVNRAFTNITGYSEFQAIGQSIDELLSIETGLESLHSILSSLEAGRSWEGELNLNKKSSDPFQAWVTVTATTTEAGDISQHLTIFPRSVCCNNRHNNYITWRIMTR